MNQILVTGVPGLTLDAETAKMFRSVQPGGYILFARNIVSAPQLRKLIDDLRDLSDVEPIIMVDEEGGRVSRLRQIGNELPSPQQYRERGRRDLVTRHGALTGQLMRLFGMNLNLCPVVEVSFDDEADNSLRGRCYGTSAKQVVEFAGEFNKALRGEGILSCGKHFPGYAGVVVDPHHELPATHRTQAQLYEAELIPYLKMSSELDSIMTGHTWYSCFDGKELPSSLSSNVIKKLLREEIGYSGLVISDDLDMGALLEKYTQAESIRMAVEAGNDQLLICHRVASLEQAADALKTVASADIDRALENIHHAKRKLSAPSEFSEAQYAALNDAVWDLRVETLGEEQAKVRNVYKHKVSPVELY
ncbi:MAG: beta-N-acetylhexosaminidase [Lentimonas sp.]|jgi:beta-N-acetylhexosaminidase